MGSIKTLLNPAKSTDETAGTHTHTPPSTTRPPVDPYDRAEAIVRSMTPTSINTTRPLASNDKRLLQSPNITSTSDIHYHRYVSPTPAPPSRTTSPALSEASPRKKTKIVKDAPVFVKGATRGEVRYAPFVYANADDEEDEGAKEEEKGNDLQAYHDHFSVFPRQEDVGEFPRFIPYNSERRIFADATGRDFFEVFQYEFKPPGREEDKTYTMLWDYNVGLVRTTPLFKCCGYGKTTPAKMLNRNVGLREICHSITGGALVAQGYWMPYEAAKAVAATFCWSIRYALTPVFGIDFIDMCVPPDSEKFGVMMIDANITRICTEQAKAFKKLEFESPHPRPTLSAMASPRTPTSPVYQRTTAAASRFKAINNISDETSSSGYSTEASDDGYVMSPTAPMFRQVGWKREVPRSTPRTRLSLTPSPKSHIPRVRLRKERDDDEEYAMRVTTSSKRSSPAASIQERREDMRMLGLGLRGQQVCYRDEDGEMDVDPVGLGVSGVEPLRYHGQEEGKLGGKGKGFGDKEAASALLSLWGVRKVPERRASA